jgi:histidine ammonia-lyase
VEVVDTNEHSPGEGRETRTVVFGRDTIRIEDVVALACGEAEAALDDDPGYRAKLKYSQQLLQELFEAGRTPIYGMSTGYGSSAGNAIPAELVGNLGVNLFRFHGVGTGRILDDDESAAVVSARLPGLALGHSGVGAVLLERLCLLLNERLLPRIPAEGSVGASGDLTPLSYLAATLAGEREVSLRGRLMPAADALREIRVDPLHLSARECLALMNGTSAMTGLACLAFDRARKLALLAATVTAMVSDAILGNREHFSARIFELKPHPGSIQAAAWIRNHLGSGPDRAPVRLQDRYSIRCAPHVIGVLLDTLVSTREILEIELNSVDDNPLLDLENGVVLHGGNFHGAHVCAAMDSLKVAVASVADLLDRQLVLLCAPDTSGGLPENLVYGSGPESLVHHGFKAMQITASALTAEALKLTLPAAAFSRSTESHNQDKVSMGTIAARDCLRILELSESVAAIGLLAAAQAVDLRGAEASSPSSVAMRDAVREKIPMLVADRRQDVDIEQVLELHREGLLPCPASTDGGTVEA